MIAPKIMTDSNFNTISTGLDSLKGTEKLSFYEGFLQEEYDED